MAFIGIDIDLDTNLNMEALTTHTFDPFVRSSSYKSNFPK